MKYKGYLAALFVFAAIVIGAFVYMNNGSGRLEYNPYGEKINVKLTVDETKTLSDIFNKKDCGDTRSCGFIPEVTVSINGIVYAPACDGCGSVLNVTKQYFFDISDEERDTLEEIFSKYGGKFPCN